MTDNTTKKNVEAVYPLSPMQEGMLFHSLYDPDEGFYFETFTCTLSGNFDVNAFERAWKSIVERHSILRTSFVWKRLDQMYQVVHRSVELPIHKMDWREYSPSVQAENLNSYLTNERARGFDLSKAPLLHLALIRIEEDAYKFVWCYHHALLDGWSQPLLLKELITLYEGFSHDKQPYFEPVPPFKNYIDWIKRQDVDEAESFWRNNLKGFDTPTPLVINHKPHTRLPVGENIEKSISFSSELTQKLKELASENQLTMNTFVLGAWSILLSRYSGFMDVCFGATVSGRPPNLPGSDRMIGLFINTLPMRVQIPQSEAVVSWLKSLQLKQLEMRQFEHSSLVNIQGWSEVPGGTPLFESILVFENYPVSISGRNQDQGLQIEDVSVSEKANYPLTLVAAAAEELFIKFSYDSRIFNDDSIIRMLGHLEVILTGIAESPEQPVDNLQILTSFEIEQLLTAWNNAKLDFPDDVCIHHLFERQAASTPDATAVSINGDTITYKELNQQANQLASYLEESGVNQEKPVGIFLEPSISFVVGILGIIKAGGVYLPLDISYPPERLGFMLSDSDLRIVLTSRHLGELFPGSELQIINVDDGRHIKTIRTHNQENIDRGIKPSNLAYIIYTSGSTGNPKGVLLEHRGLVNLVLSQIEAFSIQPGDRLLQFASISFDASISEIFTALVGGANLYLTPKEVQQSPSALAEYLLDHEINIVTLPPSLLQVLPAEDLPALTTLVSAGEKCSWEIVNRWSTGRQLINAYGPTEATVGPTYFIVPENYDKVKLESGSVPIGRPIYNTGAYILDDHLRPVPVGVIGELYISGIGLARGYLGQEVMTEESFLLHSFSGGGKIRLYKTGDLARYLPDGNIEYIGRSDQQVKIRGYRVELGEIESVLIQHPSIQNAVVLHREDESGVDRLVAYLVSDQEEIQNVSEIRQYLQDKLPSYMIPSLYISVPELPLTNSGKVDRNALPETEVGQTGLEDTYVPPRTPHEELLVGIFSHILGIQAVGIDDNFFELGGHSLLVTSLISRIRKAFQVEVDLRKVFEAPTVRELANVIQELSLREGTQIPVIQPFDREGNLPLSFAQQRLWFLDQLLPGNAFYNIPVALKLKGELDFNILERSLNEVIKRHEALRTTFILDNDEPVQIISPSLSISIPIMDLGREKGAKSQDKIEQLIIDEARKPFDLSEGPLLRVQAIKTSDHEHIMLLTLHHIIADGWSMQIFVKEIAVHYQALVSKTPTPLKPIPIQYSDYSIWQRDWLTGEILEKQKDYWRSHLSGAPSILELPMDRPRPAVQSSKGAHLSFKLPPDLSTEIKKFSQQEGATLYMVLLAGFMTLLYRYSGQTDISVGTPIANRTREEIEGLIGFFVNTLVMRGDLSGNPGFREFLHQIRNIAFDAYSHQDLPFESLVEIMQPVRDMSHTPIFQVMFTMDNVPSESIELPGLTLTPLEAESGTSKFDLTLSMHESLENLEGNFEYSTDLFDKSTIQRLVDHYQILLENIVKNPNHRIAELPLMSSKELDRVQVEWNATNAPFSSNLCFHTLFEEQASRSPDSIAISFNGEKLTYGEFDSRANQLANYLQSIGVGVESLVGVCMNPSIDLVVSLIAVWKSGGAYLPLDPNYPKERLSFMLSDSAVFGLLTMDVNIDQLPEIDVPVIVVDRNQPQISGFSMEKPISLVLPENLAYVIYTSGSTGVPKGVQLHHEGLCNVVAAQQAAFKVGPGDRVLQFSSLSFDAATFELVMALGTGAELSLGNREELLPGRDLLDFLGEKEISIIVFPPSALKVIPDGDLPKLRTITVAGETCPPALVDRWAGGRQFFNLYGPTEDTIWATYALCGENGGKPPIGRPIQNTQVYILDGYGTPVPIGVTGEMYLGGVGVARGYLNRPGLTAERFVPNPFGNGDRLYKSGDFTRHLEDGKIDFLGRADDQVKVRGFRIELGEIEAVLREHPEILEASVMARLDDPGEPRLVAYLVPDDGGIPTSATLRQFLAGKLPGYMVPSVFTTIDQLPLLPSGKVDRKSLPAPDKDRLETEAQFIPPRNELEETLVKMWQKIIRVDQIGVHDNFFELGGDSIRGAVFINQLEKVLGESIYVAALFEAQTIADLSSYLIKNHPVSVAQNIGGEKLTDAEIEALATIEREVQPVISVHPAIVPMQIHGNKIPLFCVHSAGGVVFPYYNLVPYMGYDQPLYGIQRPTSAHMDETFTSVEDLASYYVSGIRMVQPHGPYCIAGWSSGGVVAFEMANQLSQMDEEVAFLGIIDFKAPHQRQTREPRHRHGMKGRIRFGRFRLILKLIQALPYFIKEFFTLLKVALSYTRDGLYLKYRDPERRSAEKIASQDRPSMMEYLRWFWVSAIRNKLLDRADVANVVERNSDLKLIELPTVRHTLGRVGKDVRITQRYVPKVYDGNITIFNAGSYDEDKNSQSAPTMGWEDLTSGEVEVRKIPGNHMAILRKPYVEPFSDIIKDCLQKALKVSD